MATYGAICEFDDKHSKWSIYKQRLNFYFEANGITDAKQKRAIFVSVVGDKTYETLLGLVAPKEPPKVEFDELMKCLDEYYSPTPNIIVEQFKFYDCSKLDDETMLQYLTRLKSLSRSCRFGEDANGAALTSQQVLEENLRDKFVWEMKKDSRMQQRLLSETNLTYKKTVQIANAMELAQRGVECVSGANPHQRRIFINYPNTSSQLQQKNNTIPQLAQNKCASHVSDVVMIVTPRMSVSSKRTLVLIVKKLGTL